MEYIASAESIDRLHLEGLHMTDVATFKPVDTVRTVGEGKEPLEMLPQLF